MSQPILTHLSLFSGIGGLDLAAEQAGFTTIGQCEWADYPTKVLEKHWPDVPRWRDIRTLTGESFYERTGLRTVDIISGGFPCQPFSQAGKRRGKDDDRYLWPEMLRVIDEIRPTWVLGENVYGIVNMALDQVLSDLENLNYSTQAFIIPACGVDAPHRRNRVAIVGFSNSNNSRHFYGQSQIEPAKRGEYAFGQSYGLCENVSNTDNTGNGTSASRIDRNKQTENNRWAEQPQLRSSGLCEDVAYTKQPGLQRYDEQQTKSADTFNRCNKDVCYSTIEGFPNRADFSMGGREQESQSQRSNWWSVEPNVGRVANGIASRVDRLKCLGNAVVWQQFYPFFKYIAEVEGSK